MIMLKILVKSLKNPFWIFQAFEIFERKNSPKIPRKFYHVTCDMFVDLAKSHVMENSITP